MKQTNAIRFGNYVIVLEKEQLSYYVNGELAVVKDVHPEFNSKDLFDLGKRIALKKDTGAVQYVNKSDYIKK